jgi:hypothetical protein
MNTYNVEEKGCVFFHAIAESEEQVRELAAQAGYNIEGMDIELERMNVRDELGREYTAKIEDALV